MKLFWISNLFFVQLVLVLSNPDTSFTRRRDNLETLHKYKPEVVSTYNSLADDDGFKALRLVAKALGVPPVLLENIVQERMDTFFAMARDYNVSMKCLNETETTFSGIFQEEGWALRMADSIGKPPSGILEIDLTWLGNYDECINITVSNNTQLQTDGFNAHYCYATLGMKQPAAKSEININSELNLKLNWGLCVPNSCQGDDVTAYINVVLDMLPQTNITKLLRVESVYCKDAKPLELTPHAKGCIALLVILGSVILTATFFDISLKIILSRRARQTKRPVLPSSNRNIQEASQSGSLSNSNGHVFENDDEPLIDEATIEKSVKKEMNQLGTAKKLLLAFSVYTNAPKIFNVSQNTEGQLTAVHGIRFISMTWVILGHTFFFMSTYTANLIPYYILNHIKRWTFMAIINATFSVDSFFVMSGCLLAYLTLKEFARKGGPKNINWVMFYVHRYWRLTSTYALILFSYISLFRYFADGPMYPSGEFGPEAFCKNNWWTNFLYVNNIVKSKEMCMGWTWYLANDMQFFVISPIILIGFYVHWAIGGSICLALFLVNFIVAGVINTQHKLGITIFDQTDGFDLIYIKPWTRIGSYLVGVIVGYVIFKTNRKVKIHWVINVIGWCVATVCCLAPLYGLIGDYRGDKPPLEVESLYQSLSRTSWAIGVGWVIFACSIGYGGCINTFLSWPAIVPFSRLTYCAYLVHPIIMMAVYGSTRKTIYMTDIYMIYYFFANLVASYLVAFAASLAFEAPLIGLERILLRPAPKEEIKPENKSKQ